MHATNVRQRSRQRPGGHPAREGLALPPESGNLQPYGCRSAAGADRPAVPRPRRPTRRDIVRRTMQEEHSVSALARRYPMSFAAVQKHVAVLGAGRARDQAAGAAASSSCAATSTPSATPSGCSTQLEAVWRGRIDRFGEILADDPRPKETEPHDRHERRTRTPRALTMTITAEFDAPIERVWQLWADPRQLERWWGPPTYPATVVDHDLSPGRQRHLLHDRSRGRQVARLVARARGRRAAPPRVRGRLRRRRPASPTRTCRR